MNRKISITLLISTLIFYLLAVIGCSGGGGSTEIGNPSSVRGVIQKGPFYTGATIVIKELDDTDLTPTGIEHTAQTTNDLGEFIADSNIESAYIEISATGYFYSEIDGIQSNAPITLSAFVDVTKTQEVNINILTSIAIKREKYLIIHEEKTYEDAKIQTQREILNIFEISEEIIEEIAQNGEDIDLFAHMNIGEDGVKNAVLLALSIILQSNQPTEPVAQVIETIGNDIEMDGVFDNPQLIDDLLIRATAVDLQQIRENLKDHYESLSANAAIPPFERFIQVSAPIFNLPASTYNSDITVELISETPGADIYYTVNDGDPIHYEAPIEISGDETIVDLRAMAVKSKMIDSFSVSSYYSIKYDYDPSTYNTDMTLSDYQANMVGTWIGNAQSPWVSPYNVKITIYDTMHYSAQSISHFYTYSGIYQEYSQWWGPAFYYGTDEDSEVKTLDIYEIHDNGKAAADIVILFDIGTTNVDSLNQISMSDDFNHLQFDFWHHDTYGPITYNLTRLTE